MKGAHCSLHHTYFLYHLNSFVKIKNLKGKRVKQTEGVYFEDLKFLCGIAVKPAVKVHTYYIFDIKFAVCESD